MLSLVIWGACLSSLGVLFLVKHPFSTAAGLGLLGILSCVAISAWSGAWLACIIFLVVYGGLVVVFGYMVALSPNPNFKVNPSGGVVCASLSVVGGLWFPLVAPESGAWGVSGCKGLEEIVGVGWMGGPLLAVMVVFLFGVMFGVSVCVSSVPGSLRATRWGSRP